MSLLDWTYQHEHANMLMLSRIISVLYSVKPLVVEIYTWNKAADTLFWQMLFLNSYFSVLTVLVLRKMSL